MDNAIGSRYERFRRLAPDGFNRSAGSLSAGLTRRSVHVKNQDADKTQRSSGQ